MLTVKNILQDSALLEVLEPPHKVKMPPLLLRHGAFLRCLLETHFPNTPLRLIPENHPLFSFVVSVWSLNCTA